MPINLGYDNRPNLSNRQFQQCSGDTITLSGYTNSVGISGFSSNNGYRISGYTIFHAHGQNAKSLEIGYLATARGDSSIALGRSADALCDKSISIGCGNIVCATGSAILGGYENTIGTGNTNTTLIGVNTCNLTGTAYSGYVVVPNLAILTPPTGSGGFLCYNSGSKKIEQTVGGGVSTANNGLNIAGTNVRLGGNLTGNTCIGLNGKTFLISGATNGICAICSTSSATVLGTSANARVAVCYGTATVWMNSGLQGITISNNNTSLYTNSTASGGISINGYAGFGGAKYNADYSANFTARSLVDAAYVTGKTSGATITAGLGITNNAGTFDLNITDTTPVGTELNVKIDSGGSNVLYVDSNDLPFTGASNGLKICNKDVILGGSPLITTTTVGNGTCSLIFNTNQIRLSGATCVAISSPSIKLTATPSGGTCNDSVLVWNSTDKLIKKVPYSSGSTSVNYWSSGATGIYPKKSNNIVIDNNKCICWSGSTAYIQGSTTGSDSLLLSANGFTSSINLCGDNTIGIQASSSVIADTETITVRSYSNSCQIGINPTGCRIYSNPVGMPLTICTINASSTVNAGTLTLGGGISSNVGFTTAGGGVNICAGSSCCGTGGTLCIKAGQQICTGTYSPICIIGLPSKTTETCAVYINANGKLSYGCVSGGTGGGGITGATNGLCKYNSTNVCLGGTLTSPVTITTGSNLFTICGGNGNYFRQNVNALGAQVSGASGCVIQNFSTSPAYTIGVCDGTDYGYFVMNGTCSSLFFNSASIQICGNCMSITDGNNSQGFVYTGNYCANSKAKPRWIPDNEYVTGKTYSVITGATNLGVGNGTILVSGNKLQLKTLSGGTNVTLTCNGNYIAINATGGGSSPVSVTNNDVIYTCKNVPSGLTSATNNILLGCHAGSSITTNSNNIAMGLKALCLSNSGGQNIAIGTTALGCAIVSGYYNIGIGYDALTKTTTGYWNTALGFDSLYSNTNGGDNIALGQCSAYGNTNGNCNIALGVMALNLNSTGNRNIAIGNCAGYNETTSDKLHIANSAACTLIYGDFVNKFVCINNRLITCRLRVLSGATAGYVLTSDASGNATWQAGGGGSGSGIGWSNLLNGSTIAGCGTIASGATVNRNTAFGVQALGAVTSTGTDNVAVGYQALCKNTTGDNNIAIGALALDTNNIGSDNIALGYHSLGSNTGGTSNIAIGFYALLGNTSANNNIAIGCRAIEGNTTGFFNVAIGTEALCKNTIGAANVGVGYFAMNQNTSGGENVAMGYIALQDNTTGCNNTAIGSQALANNTTACNNTAIGYRALTTSTTGNFNVAIGSQALCANITGSSNVAIGPQALFLNTYGLCNIAVGACALDANTTGCVNIALGVGALGANTTGCNNFAAGLALITNTIGCNNIGIGFQTLNLNLSGNDNIGLGNCALTFNSTGINNIALGTCTLTKNSIGNNNVGIGFEALCANTNNYNVGIGFQSLCKNTSGTGNVAMGVATLACSSTGNYNVGIGFGAGQGITTGLCNVAIGYRAIQSNGTFRATGCGNIAMGVDALACLTTGCFNIALGFCALGLNNTGCDNIAMGCWTMNCNTDGYRNIAMGMGALFCNTTGSENIAMGCQTMYLNCTGTYNVAIGVGALRSNTTASNNTAIGGVTLYSNTTGVGNVAIGYGSFSGALYSNTTGNNNVGIGGGALRYNTTACNNTAVGTGALLNNIDANYNTAVGYQAQANNRIGTDNVAIGANTSYSSTGGSCNVIIGGQANYRNKVGNYNVMVGHHAGAFTSGSSNVFIGHCAGYGETGSSHLYIHNTSTANPLLFGDFAANRLKVNGTLEVVNGTCNYLYLGDKDTNGSWRFVVSGSSLVVQVRTAGVWGGNKQIAP